MITSKINIRKNALKKLIFLVLILYPSFLFSHTREKNLVVYYTALNSDIIISAKVKSVNKKELIILVDSVIMNKSNIHVNNKLRVSLSDYNFNHQNKFDDDCSSNDFCVGESYLLFLNKDKNLFKEYFICTSKDVMSRIRINNDSLVIPSIMLGYSSYKEPISEFYKDYESEEDINIRHHRNGIKISINYFYSVIHFICSKYRLIQNSNSFNKSVILVNPYMSFKSESFAVKFDLIQFIEGKLQSRTIKE